MNAPFDALSIFPLLGPYNQFKLPYHGLVIHCYVCSHFNLEEYFGLQRS